jgi:hypothetical protein
VKNFQVGWQEPMPGPGYSGLFYRKGVIFSLWGRTVRSYLKNRKISTTVNTGEETALTMNAFQRCHPGTAGRKNIFEMISVHINIQPST